MSLFVKLMIGGWSTAFAMFGLYALKESGKLLEIHKRIGLWLETSAPRFNTPEESLEPEGEDVA
ncbi:MAG: hypothetical protein WCF61_14150 [Terriglobales bacterium]